MSPRCRRSCASARALAARRGSSPARSRRARWRCRWRGPRGPRGDGPPPEAWLIAAKDTGPLTSSTGSRCTRRSRSSRSSCCAGASSTTPSAAWRATCSSALVSGDLAGPSSRGGWSRSACASAPGVLVSPRAGGARARPRRRSRGRCARRPAAGASRPRALLCALLPAAATTSCSRSPSGCTRGGARKRASRCRRRGARRRARGAAARLPRARCALEGAAPAVNGEAKAPRALATCRDLGSFQLLLSLQDDDALRLFCDSILAPIEESEGAYGGELMRSLEAFIECNGQWERAANALLPPSHAALPDPPRGGADQPSLDSARDRIDFWLALRGGELCPTERN